MPGAALAAFRLPRGFAAPYARFFFGCLLVNRVVRRMRGFAAMIPHAPPWISVACRRGRSHDGL
jgi:hypothetical protein